MESGLVGGWLAVRHWDEWVSLSVFGIRRCKRGCGMG